MNIVKTTTLFFCLFVITTSAQTSADYDALANKMDEAGKYKQAVKYYKKALQLDPNNSNILENLFYAKCNISKGRTAITYLDKLIAMHPNSSKFYFLRAYSYFKQKKYVAAVNDYSQAILKQEDKISNFTIYPERGLCKLRLKDYKGAKEDFDQLLSVYPNAAVMKYKTEAEFQISKQENKYKSNTVTSM